MNLNFPDDDDNDFEAEIGGFHPAMSYEPTEDEIAGATEKLRELDSEAQKLGLYMQTTQLAVTPPIDERPPSLILVVDFLPGDKAWSNKVHNPERVDLDKQFREIKTEMSEDEFEEYRESLRRKIEGD